MPNDDAARNRLRVAMGVAAPTALNNVEGGGTGYFLAMWPCKRDHGHDNAYQDNAGKLRCRICESEKRKKNREENRDRERRRVSERYRRKVPDARPYKPHKRKRGKR